MNKYLLILLLSCFVLCASAREQSDSTTIYQGMSIKLDLANPVLELVRSKGSVQDYEMA